MIERVLGWGKQHGRLSHILVQVAVQTVLWTSVFTIIGQSNGLTAAFLRQDFPILLFGSVLLLILGLWSRKIPSLPDFLTKPLVWLLALAVLIATSAGTWLVFADTPLTRDEILADFDAKFLATGKLIGSPPLEWRPYLDALMPQFMLEVPSNLGWLSGYLPGNAALRALGELTVGVEWVNPVLAALSILVLFAVGRRLWPEGRSPAVLAVLLCASSAQVLTGAMTPFAMTAHLAFNLVWLWGFLRGNARGDACAIGAGFVATGLHQLVFHPLFVAPFILYMWNRRERRRAIVYVAAYAAIGLFWVCYWQILFAGADASQGNAATASGFSYLVGRVAGFLADLTLDAPLMMGANLLRFAAWQNLALIPFVAVAWPAIRSGEGITRPLAAGIVLTIGAMLVLLPWQGLGWGYRYFHGLIGSFCLLAGYGWNSIRNDERRRFVLAVTTVVSFLVIVPVQLKLVHDYAAPRARAFMLASRMDADIVMIVPAEDLYDDLVRNDPDLSNRPKLMDVRKLTSSQIDALCSRYRVAVFDIRYGVLAGLPRTASDKEIQRYSLKPGQVDCAQPLPLRR